MLYNLIDVSFFGAGGSNLLEEKKPGNDLREDDYLV